MTAITLTYRVIHKKINTISFPRINLPRINWKLVCWAGALSVLSMLILYVALVNQLTGGSYLIKNYNKELKAEMQENKVLKAHFAEVSLLGQVTQRVKELNFEKTTSIKYLQIVENSLAKAK